MTKTIHNYLLDKYNKTGFTFTGLVEVCNKFGTTEAKKALNELNVLQKVRRRKGANEILIELININETN